MAEIIRDCCVENKFMNFYDSNGNIKSNTDPTKYLTFEYWIYMVPQYKPKSVLMLGVAGATTAGLIRKIYGEEVEITGVDIVPCEPLYGMKFIQADAKDFVKTCEHYDCVLVDLFPDEELAVCDFVTTSEFAENLAKIADYIIINTAQKVDLSAYNFLKQVAAIKPPGLINTIFYFEVNKIADLMPFEK